MDIDNERKKYYCIHSGKTTTTLKKIINFRFNIWLIFLSVINL